MSDTIEKKIDDIPAKVRGKYTELELRTRGIGKFHETQTREWTTKLSTYHDEEVKRAFMAIKRSLALLCTDVEGYHYHEMAHQTAHAGPLALSVLRSPPHGQSFSLNFMFQGLLGLSLLPCHTLLSLLDESLVVGHLLLIR